MTDRLQYTRLREGYRESGTRALGSTAATIIMNTVRREREVSDRTDTTRRIGAYEALVTLMSGDDELYRLYDGIVIGEFLGRAVAVARQHGVVIPNRSVKPLPDEGQAIVERVRCYPDEVDFPIPGLEIEDLSVVKAINQS